jgi:hypothetical protein
MTDLLLIAIYIFRRQQAYSVGLFKALRTGDVADIASGFQKIASTRKLSLFEVESISIFQFECVDLIYFIGIQFFCAEESPFFVDCCSHPS